MEDEFLFKDWVEVVPDDTSSVRLLAQRGDDEGVHVERGTSDVALRRQVCHLLDLDKENTSNSTHTVELVSRQLSLALQASKSVSLLPLFGLLGAARVIFIIVIVLVDGVPCSGKLIEVFVSVGGVFKGNNTEELLERLLGGGVGVDRIEDGEL